MAGAPTARSQCHHHTTDADATAWTYIQRHPSSPPRTRGYLPFPFSTAACERGALVRWAQGALLSTPGHDTVAGGAMAGMETVVLWHIGHWLASHSCKP
eukprot:scaffold2621_cov124-Isochrysis_galbana.AAC.1